MANNERTGQHATSSNWANVGALVRDEQGFRNVNRVLSDAIFSVPESTGEPVLFAVTNDANAEPDSDIFANTIGAGESRFIRRVNLDVLWVKSANASVFEWSGTPEG
jgi:hypothetical protein